MANVINRITKEIRPSVNTPDFQEPEWMIINELILPDCLVKWWVIEVSSIREMTQLEKDELAYSTESTIYLITEKQLLTRKNGNEYEDNTDAIINPVMPDCDLKYTKAVDGLVVEMTISEKKEVDKPNQIREHNEKVTEEIRLKYSEYDEMKILRDFSFGELTMSNQKMIEYKQAVIAAESKHPEIKGAKA